MEKSKQQPAAPRPEQLEEYIDFSTQINSVATTIMNPNTAKEIAPPPATLIPANYKVGDGLRRIVTAKQQNDFYTDVYGRSSRYLEEITPSNLGRK